MDVSLIICGLCYERLCHVGTESFVLNLKKNRLDRTFVQHSRYGNHAFVGFQGPLWNDL